MFFVRKKMDRLKSQPLVSIVIPIVPKDIHIQECVDHIKRSTYQNYEILIINESKERSYQRNVGIKNAKGKYLIWLDSDMMISPMLLENCVDKMESDEEVWIKAKQSDGKGGFLVSRELAPLLRPLVGIYIPERIVTKGWFGKLRDWERQFYTATLVDVMRFVRTKDCPLFDETLHGVEDSDWERQFPEGRREISDYSFNHHDKVGLIKYLKKKAYYAQCLGRYTSKNPSDKLLTFKYRCFQVFTENGKWKRFISNPIMATGVLLLLLARGIVMLTAKRI